VKRLAQEGAGIAFSYVSRPEQANETAGAAEHMMGSVGAGERSLRWSEAKPQESFVVDLQPKGSRENQRRKELPEHGASSLYADFCSNRAKRYSESLA